MTGLQMRYKIFWVGIFLFLCSACLPHAAFLSQITDSDTSPPARENSGSLFAPSELESLLAQAPTPSRAERSPHLVPLSGGDPLSLSPELSMSDESNDDSYLQFFPDDQSEKEPAFDIPIVMNPSVEQFIEYFHTTIREKFSGWLARSEKYIPLMKNLLRENGLPQDLAYLTLIESGLNPYAYSRSKALGLWQFIAPTGKRYGLKVDRWVDERRDPEKSTVAAARYLKDLYEMFECWYLAAASYNAGEGKIAKGIKRYRTEDFWQLTKYRYLKKETKDYVPQMIAAAMIAKTPEQYGFVDIEYEDPLCYEKVNVPEVTGLGLIARACDIPLEELKDLNPELLRGVTPPGVPDYEMKIPCGKKELFLQNFESIRPAERLQFKIHVVKKGETPIGIAKKYRIELQPFLEMNDLNKNGRLPTGTDLVIPIPKVEPQPTPPKAKKELKSKKKSPRPQQVTYHIQKKQTPTHSD